MNALESVLETTGVADTMESSRGLICWFKLLYAVYVCCLSKLKYHLGQVNINYKSARHKVAKCLIKLCLDRWHLPAYSLAAPWTCMPSGATDTSAARLLERLAQAVHFVLAQDVPG